MDLPLFQLSLAVPGSAHYWCQAFHARQYEETRDTTMEVPVAHLGVERKVHLLLTDQI